MTLRFHTQQTFTDQMLSFKMLWSVGFCFLEEKMILFSKDALHLSTVTE